MKEFLHSFLSSKSSIFFTWQWKNCFCCYKDSKSSQEKRNKDRNDVVLSAKYWFKCVEAEWKTSAWHLKLISNLILPPTSLISHYFPFRSHEESIHLKLMLKVTSFPLNGSNNSAITFDIMRWSQEDKKIPNLINQLTILKIEL